PPKIPSAFGSPLRRSSARQLRSHPPSSDPPPCKAKPTVHSAGASFANPSPDQTTRASDNNPPAKSDRDDDRDIARNRHSARSAKSKQSSTSPRSSGFAPASDPEPHRPFRPAPSAKIPSPPTIPARAHPSLSPPHSPPSRPPTRPPRAAPRQIHPTAYRH